MSKCLYLKVHMRHRAKNRIRFTLNQIRRMTCVQDQDKFQGESRSAAKRSQQTESNSNLKRSKKI